MSSNGYAKPGEDPPPMPPGPPSTPCSPIPDWVADEIRATWKTARDSVSQMEAFRVFERMTERLGYGRWQRDDCPSLANDQGMAREALPSPPCSGVADEPETPVKQKNHL